MSPIFTRPIRSIPQGRRCVQFYLYGAKQRPAIKFLQRPQTATVRFASTVSDESSSLITRLKNLFYGTSFVLGIGIIYLYITDTRASAHRWIVVPALRLAYPDPEDAHHAGNSVLKALWRLGLYPRERGDPDSAGDLKVDFFGHTLTNPIGTSAGIDKHADIPDPLFALGPSIIEIGGTTPLPQSGNEKPRVFRISSQNAMINRYGLNSEGADHVAMRLRQRVRDFAYSMGLGHDVAAERFVLDGHAGVPPGSLTPGRLLAVNIAKNKITPEHDVEAVKKDYIYCVEQLAPYADIVVVNVSSPNTPGLRSLQQAGPLTSILTGVVEAAKQTNRKTKPFVMVKVSPDEDSDEQIEGICEAMWASGIDGVIVGNTTNRRPEPLTTLKPLSPLEEQALLETGGFSGPHLFESTVALVKRYKKLLDGRQSTPAQKVDFRAELEKEAGEIEQALGVEETSLRISTGLTSRRPSDSVQSSVETGGIALNAPSPEEQSEKKQPLFRLPQEKLYDQPSQELEQPLDVDEASRKSSTVSTGTSSSDSVQSSVDSDRSAPKSPRSEEQSNKKQPLFRLPEERQYELPSQGRERLQAIKEAIEQLPARDEKVAAADKPKVIFATGGITNGKQALEVLNAGASVAMVYTALVYGGAGTITRIKDEMREQMKDEMKAAQKAKRKAAKPSKV